MRLAIFLLFFTSFGFGQTAKVIQLTVNDAVAAADLAKQERELRAKRAQLDAEIKRKYLTVRSSDLQSGSCTAGREGEDGLTVSGSSSNLLYSDGTHWTAGPYSGRCETGAERDAREAAEIKVRKAQAKYEREHPALSYRAGWGCGEFIYSEDYLYITPPPPPVKAMSDVWTVAR